MLSTSVRSTVLVALVAGVLALAPASATAAPAPETAPTNDAFSSVETLTPRSGEVAGTNVGATKQAGEPDHAGDPGGASVWYRWTSDIDGFATFGVCGDVELSPVLAVYTGTSVGGLTEVGSSNHPCLSDLVIEVQGGTTYRIAVDGFLFDALEMGEFTLRWAGPEPGAQRPDVLVRSGRSGPWLGDDIYNTTGARQTSTASVRPGGSATFSFKYQNDGDGDTTRIRGSASNSQFLVTYQAYRPDGVAVDITAAFTTGETIPFPAGFVLRVIAKVTARPGTAAGATIGVKVKATSTGTTIADVAVARVTRV